MEPQDLEDYLAGDFHQDMDDIGELEGMLAAVQDVFVHSCDGGRWPYERRAGQPILDVRMSHGTQSMIAAALGKMTGQCTMASGELARLPGQPHEGLSDAQEAGVNQLLASLDSGDLTSGTFGRNDPVTLSHLTELMRGMDGVNDAKRVSEFRKKIRAAEVALKRVLRENPALSQDLLPQLPSFGSSYVAADGSTESASSPSKPKYVINAFVPLKIVRSVYNLASLTQAHTSDLPNHLKLDGPEFDEYRKYFESTLYDQLSFSAIPDSRFDAAELIFCLEGLLLCGRQTVDERVFEHVIEVLRDKQELSAQWRPNRPIFATPQGMTMLPVSVESAVSLVRSIEIMDRRQNYHRFSSLGLGLARRFWHWLRAHRVQIHAPTVGGQQNVELRGWHSEHVDDPNLIHLWATSQVVEFMMAFREMLQRHLAGRTLSLSRLKLDRGPRERSADWKKKWDRVARVFEPRPESGNQVYIDRLTNDFVIPWGERRPTNFSMLLYGPPGTGKSSLAENLADALGMRMITVTISDFLGRGGENVEARAKAIFQTLEAQFDTVILFDEIDSFLLDRDTERYGLQDSLFQFLTPGMLTKINDLRRRERSIFIIATNYANRIDPAIKRRGRIDQRYLLSLPSAAKRLEIIADLRGGIAVAPDKEGLVAKETLFFGFADLKNLVKDAKRRGEGDAGLLHLLSTGEYRPATSIKTYLARMTEENFPFEELVELEALNREVDNDFDLFALAGVREDAVFADGLREWVAAATAPSFTAQASLQEGPIEHDRV